MAQDPRLVEMVAKALCAKLDIRFPESIIGPLSNTEVWQRYVPAAEAAIAVINRSMNPEVQP